VTEGVVLPPDLGELAVIEYRAYLVGADVSQGASQSSANGLCSAALASSHGARTFVDDPPTTRWHISMRSPLGMRDRP